MQEKKVNWPLILIGTGVLAVGGVVLWKLIAPPEALADVLSVEPWDWAVEAPEGLARSVSVGSPYIPALYGDKLYPGKIKITYKGPVTSIYLGWTLAVGLGWADIRTDRAIASQPLTTTRCLDWTDLYWDGAPKWALELKSPLVELGELPKTFDVVAWVTHGPPRIVDHMPQNLLGGYKHYDDLLRIEGASVQIPEPWGWALASRPIVVR